MAGFKCKATSKHEGIARKMKALLARNRQNVLCRGEEFRPKQICNGAQSVSNTYKLVCVVSE